MKKKILLVDDDPTIMSFLSPLLAKKNYHAVHAKDGKDALEKIASEAPDLIISDIMMPVMDGFELYQNLRKSPETGGVPFIFLSSKDAPTDQLKGLRMGAKEYLTKPFDVTKLFATIKNVLANAEKDRLFKERIDFSGNLAEINFEDIVQLIEMNQKTGELVFATHEDEAVGSAFFKDGNLVYAETGALDGKEAFYDLAANPDGYVKFFSREINEPEMISGQIMSLLFEAARMQDEAKILYTLIDDMDVTFHIKSRKVPPEIVDAVGFEWISKIFKMIKQKQTAREMIHSGEMSRPRAENALVELIKAGLVRLKEKVIVDGKNHDAPGVRIMTDTAADLPDEISRKSNLTIVPYTIQSGNRLFVEGLDITQQRFNELMDTSERSPRFYPASDDDIHALFAKIITDNDILSIFMSQKISCEEDISGAIISQNINCNYENALNAKKSHYDEYLNQRSDAGDPASGPKIEIIDSKLVSMGMGLLVIEAMDKIDAGWSVTRVGKHVKALIPKVRVLFLVNSLENFKYGWQVENARVVKRNKKALLSMHNGEGRMEMIAQVKDGNEGRQHIERLIREDLLQYLGVTQIKAAVMHGNDPGWADKMSRILKERFNCSTPIRSLIGPIIRAHFGADTVGVAYFPVPEP